jgi:hypothetical protein
MAFQSFVAPMLLGLESFGQQIIFLSSVLLSQAIFEPIVQTICNRSALHDERILNVSNILLGFFISCCTCFASLYISGAENFGLPLLTLLLILYLSNTFFAAISFSENAIGIVAVSSSGLLFTYLIGFGLSHIFLPGWELIVGLTLGMSASVALFCGYWIRNGWGRIIKLGSLNFGEVLNGFTFRLPTVVLTTVNILFLSWFGFSATVIGQYKIFVSVIMAGRYFNLVPLPQAQMYLQMVFTNGNCKETREALLRYAVSFAIFTLVASLILPMLFDYAFKDRQFSRVDLLLSSGAILLQPTAYAALASRGQNNISVTAISIIACALFGSVFIFVTKILQDPFIATGPSVIVTLCFYWVSLRHAKRDVSP